MRVRPFGLALVVVILSCVPLSAEAQQVEDTPSSLYKDSWAVLIGINDYRHPSIAKLRYAVNDVRAIERTLLAQGFRPNRITRLTDAEATKARIEGVLGDQLRQRVGPQDRVLVFFAGHGKTETLRGGEEEGYLFTADTDPLRVFSTAISMSALRQISDRLTAKHILYIVDACYSGYAIYNRSTSSSLLQEIGRQPAIQILTAGRKQDEAQERAGYGVFTEVLVRGLEGDAFGDKSWLSLEELGVWVKQRVFAESDRRQLPQYGNLSGEGQFVFMKSTTARISERQAPADPGVPEIEGVKETVPGGFHKKRGIPLPSDAKIVSPKATGSPARAAFSGQWFGTWEGNKLEHILIVERINGEEATVIYAFADSAAWQVSRSYVRVKGSFADDGKTLVVKLQRPATVTYTMRKDGRLDASYSSSGGTGIAVMRKLSADE